MTKPSVRSPDPNKRRILRIAVTLVVFALCAVAAARLDWVGAGRTLAHAHVGWLALSALVNFPFILVQSYRWRFLLGPAGRVPTLSLFRYLLASRAVSNLLPARAGELLRIYLPRTRDGLPTVTVTSTLFIERFFDALGLALLATPLLFLPAAPSWVKTGLLILVAASFSGLALTYFFALRGSRRKESFFDRIAQSAESLRSPLTALVLMGLTLVCWIAEWVMVMTCLAAARLPAAPHIAILVLLAVNLGMILQVTPANVGPFEASAILALAALGIDEPRALAFAVMYHLVQIVPVTLAGFQGIRFVAEARREEARPEKAPSQGAAPEGAAPEGAAPESAAPESAAPEGAAPEPTSTKLPSSDIPPSQVSSPDAPPSGTTTQPVPK